MFASFLHKSAGQKRRKGGKGAYESFISLVALVYVASEAVGRVGKSSVTQRKKKDGKREGEKNPLRTNTFPLGICCLLLVQHCVYNLSIGVKLEFDKFAK